MEKLIAYIHSDKIDINNGSVLRNTLCCIENKYTAFCFKRIQLISEKDFEATIERIVGGNLAAGIYSYYCKTDGSVVRLQDYTLGS